MKNHIYKNIILLCISIFSIQLSAQTTCNVNFTVNVTPTESTCQSNGTVTVTLGGDITNLIGVQYGLSTPGDPDGFKIQPQANNVLSGIPAGSYDITVRAFCSVDHGYDVVKTITNVVVTGTYKVIYPSLSANHSRKSYLNCSTGIIALDVKGGNGNFAFKITKAPAPSLEGVVTLASKAGTVYTFAGSYPAGDYKVEVSDACFNAIAEFTLGSITDSPTPRTADIYFYPVTPNPNCGLVSWRIGNVDPSNGDHLQYYNHNMYEVNLSTGVPDDSKWVAWNSATILYDISPNTFADYYTAGSAKVYVRVKGCTDYFSFTGKMKKPYNHEVGPSYRYYCSYYTYTFRPWGDYDGMWCYPLNFELKRRSDGVTVWNHTLNQYDVNYLTTGNLDYSEQGDPAIYYDLISTDANGTTLNQIIQAVRGRIIPTYVNYCNHYTASYTVPICHPITVTVTDLNNVIVHGPLVVNDASSSASQKFDLEYGKEYKMTAVNTAENYSFSIDIKPRSKLTYSMFLYQSSSCIEHGGVLRFSSSGTNINGIPLGSTITVTGPAGYTSQTYTSTYAPSFRYDFPETYLPAGTYTATIDESQGGGACIKTVDLVVPDLYSGSALGYNQVEDCSGLVITPTGQITYNGASQTTYYRLTSGPAGYDKSTVVKYGETDPSKPKGFTLSAGTYKLGILTTNSSVACVLKEVEINYNPQQFELDKVKTTAYVCDGEIYGHILISAKNGRTPYIYELYNEDKTVLLKTVTSNTGAHFDGIDFSAVLAGTKYTVVSTDACNNNFDHTVDVVDLSTARIVYANNNGQVCKGGTIQLNCMTLGETQYRWEGPNGWTASNTQSPAIPNAQPNMSGWYKVIVQPEFCGNEMKDSVYINVNELPSLPTVLNTSLTYCENDVAPSLVSATGVLAAAGHTLSWYAADGTTVITPPATISTATTGIQEFYVSQTSDQAGCESAKTKITITVNARPATPATIDPVSDKCPNEVFTITVQLPIAGYVYKVYDASLGGTLLGTSAIGSGVISGITAPSTAGSYTYYVAAAVNSASCESSIRKAVTFTVKTGAAASDITVTGDLSVCYGAQTTLTLSSSVTNPVYKWYSSQTATIPEYTGYQRTITNITSSKVYYVSVSGNNVCENEHGNRKVITINIREAISSYPSVRVWACPQNTINLTKYIDITDFSSIIWTPAASFNSGGINNGTITDATLLKSGQTYTYSYSVTNSCITDDAKLYLTIVNENNVKPNTDEVRICKDFAKSIQLNPIFGIETQGTWTCTPAAASAYLNVLAAPPFAGTAIFKGEDAWADPAIPFTVANKEITITFTPSVGSCLHGQSYTVKIILTPDITN